MTTTLSPDSVSTSDVVLLRKTLEYVEANPHEWQQDSWVTPCGTAGCFAFHLVRLAGFGVGYDAKGASFVINVVARHVARLDCADATDLFYGFNSLADLRRVVDRIAADTERLGGPSTDREGITMTTITAEQRSAIADALGSPHLHIGRGLGTADTPGRGETCTIAEIMLVLTGRLDDGPHPCISNVIRRWVRRVQDAMPDDLRNALAWRDAAVGIAGSAASDDVERARASMVLDWMWDRLGDEAVLRALPSSVRPAWDRMLIERTQTAAQYAGDAARAAYDAAAAHAADAAAAAAAHAADAAALAAVRAADAAYDDYYWRRADPAGMLARLVQRTTP